MTPEQIYRKVLFQNLVAKPQLDECFQIYRSYQNSGIEKPFFDILLEKKYLTPQQLAGLQIQLGNYQIMSFLGQGATATVYKARHLPSGQVLAIKIMTDKKNPEKTHEERFRREVETVISLNHPCLIRGYEYANVGGCRFFAMELVDGKTLREMLKEKQGETNISDATQSPDEEAPPAGLDEDLVLYVAEKVTEVLKYIEEKHLVHRDIKPDNIMFIPPEEVKLCDLGLAKVVGENASATLTQAGAIVGTPFYVSPELIKGQKDIDIRSDFYSLGATLSHLLLGYPVFDGPTPAVVYNYHLIKKFPPYREFKDKLPRNVYYLLKKMMEKEPWDRHRNSEELLADIRNVQEGAMPAGFRKSPVDIADAPTSGLPIPLPLLILAGVVFLINISAAVYFMMPSEKPSRRVNDGDQKEVVDKDGAKLPLGPLEKILAEVEPKVDGSPNIQWQVYNKLVTAIQKYPGSPVLDRAKKLEQNLASSRLIQSTLELKKKLQEIENRLKYSSSKNYPDIYQQLATVREKHRGSPLDKKIETLLTELKKRPQVRQIAVKSTLDKLLTLKQSEREKAVQSLGQLGDVGWKGVVNYIAENKGESTPILPYLKKFPLPTLRLVDVRVVLKGTAGWESGILRHPYVFYSQGRWHMFYICGKYLVEGTRIGYATSRNGVKWSKPKLILNTPNWMIDKRKGNWQPFLSLSFPTGFYDTSKKIFHLFTQVSWGGVVQYVLRYTSRDGLKWTTKKDDTHIITPVNYRHYSPTAIKVRGSKYYLWTGRNSEELVLFRNTLNTASAKARNCKLVPPGLSKQFGLSIWPISRRWLMVNYPGTSRHSRHYSLSLDGIHWWGQGQLRFPSAMINMPRGGPVIRSVIPIRGGNCRVYFAGNNQIYTAIVDFP